MKVVSQNYIDVEAECLDFHSSRKNFVNGRGYFRKLAPAMLQERNGFQLTLHTVAQHDSPVIGFACGRILTRATVDVVAVIELMGVLPAYQRQGIGTKIHEFIIKETGVPVVAAHIQTPAGCALWFHMIRAMRNARVSVVRGPSIQRILAEDDIPTEAEMCDGSDITFIMDKRFYGKVEPRLKRPGLTRFDTAGLRALS